MKYKTEKYNLIVIAIIILLGTSLFIIFGELYNRRHVNETWLTCTYPSIYKNYEETIRFHYVKGTLYGYYRDELFISTDQSEIEKYYDYFQKRKEEAGSGRFDYNIKTLDNGVQISTYIKVLNNESFFNQYIKELNIDTNDDLKTIKKSLETDNYTCEIKNNH